MAASLLLFQVGFVRRTPDAMLQLVTASQTESCFIYRHERGDFGEADACQCLGNMCAIAAHQGVVRSVYRLQTGARLSIETNLATRETRLIVAHTDHRGTPSRFLAGGIQLTGDHHG